MQKVWQKTIERSPEERHRKDFCVILVLFGFVGLFCLFCPLQHGTPQCLGITTSRHELNKEEQVLNVSAFGCGHI